MKEMQDFEKVERIHGEDLLRAMSSGNLNQQWTDWVSAKDYDALLAYAKEAYSKGYRDGLAKCTEITNKVLNPLIVGQSNAN